METGYVKTLQLDKGFYFIAVNGGNDVFAHRNDLSAELEWDELLQHRRVRFDLAYQDGRQRAVNVRPAD